MPSPLSFDSDWDYYDSLMSPKARVLQDIEDGGDHMNRYLLWAKSRPRDVEDSLLGNERLLETYAELTVEEDEP